MSFVSVIEGILRRHPEGMTPQEIRDTIKEEYSEFYGTESHRRNVAKLHYKDLDHALLAQIYSASHAAKRIVADKSQKPVKLRLLSGQETSDNDASKNTQDQSPSRPRKGEADKKYANSRLPRPSQGLILEYLQKWGQLESYRLQEASLSLLFNDLCPSNSEIEHVLLKVSALNDFYSTHIFDTYAVAKHIVARNVDHRLDACDYSLVNDLATISIRGKSKNFYSFASKYCSHHNPVDYPIFDFYVEKMLMHYKKADEFCRFNKADLKDYNRFIEVIQRFQQFYELKSSTLREIDIFLWLAGKEWFPKKYY